MTSPRDDELLELATLYALHALSEDDIAAVDDRVAQAPPELADAFRAEVQAVHEAMAAVSAATAAEPPPELRDALLAAIATDPVRALPERASRRWRTVAMAAAAAVVIGLGAVGVGIAVWPEPTIAEQVVAAPDATTVKGSIPGGGTATLVYSRAKNAGVLTMTDVPPPSEGTVYQMWLVPTDGTPVSAGVMGPTAVTPTTTAVVADLDDSTALAFTIEPGLGSDQPTSSPFAQLPLAT